MNFDDVVALGEKGREKGRGRGWTAVVLSGLHATPEVRHPSPKAVAVTAATASA